MSFVTAELDFDDLEIEQISRRVAGEDAARFQDDKRRTVYTCTVH